MLFFQFHFPCLQNKVACVNAHTALIQLCTDGFHQHRHWGGRPCDVGGACVNHSCAALCAKHHLHSHWNTARWKKKQEHFFFIGGWIQAHVVETQVVSLTAKLLPFHGYLPLAHLFSIHIIEVACVVVWVCAAQDQFSTWKVFWVSEHIKMTTN